MAKLSINLLQAGLIPETPFITLRRVAILWSSIVVTLLLAIFIANYLVSNATAEYNNLKNANKSLTKSVASLEGKLKNLKPSPKLASELEQLKALMKHKEYFYQQLTDKSRVYDVGFSHAMNELSSLHHKDISLRTVSIEQNNISFRGTARTPNAVPNWLSRFEQSSWLAGKSFVRFNIHENEDKFTEFIVSSAPKKVKSINAEPALIKDFKK